MRLERVIDLSNMGGTLGAPPIHSKSVRAPLRTPGAAALALYHATKRFGITEAAASMGMSADVLRKKLSPTCDSHQLTLDEAERLTAVIADPAGAIAFALGAGMACITMPRAETGSVPQGFAELVKQFAEMASEYATATGDNVISENDCARFDHEGADVVVAIGVESRRLRAACATREPVVQECAR